MLANYKTSNQSLVFLNTLIKSDVVMSRWVRQTGKRNLAVTSREVTRLVSDRMKRCRDAVYLYVPPPALTLSISDAC